MSIKSQELVVKGIQLQIEGLKNQVKVLEIQLLEERDKLLKEKYLDYIDRIPDKEVVALFEGGVFFDDLSTGAHYLKEGGRCYGQLWARYEWRKTSIPNNNTGAKAMEGVRDEYHYLLLVNYFEGDKETKRSLKELLVALSND